MVGTIASLLAVIAILMVRLLWWFWECIRKWFLRTPEKVSPEKSSVNVLKKKNKK